tara:strand:+ start:3360 stop:5510 length:2151 start_codon:yes stop_codon:yes gene_type:complete
MTERKSLKDYKWKPRYSGRVDNLVEDFYIPALERSRFYYRSAGYFRSSAITVAFRGISSFVESGEKMKFIVGASLTEEDAKALNDGETHLGDVLSKKWEDCKKDFDSDIVKKRFEVLAWLISNNKLEFRIAVNKDKTGRYLSSNESYYHPKILIFEDYEGNMIQLDGSINETLKAWIHNRENFAVHKSWVTNQNTFVEDAKREFDILWNKEDVKTELVDLPNAIKKDLVELVPEKKPTKELDIDFSDNKIKEYVLRNEKPLRRFQKDAIEELRNKDYIGILEMATGTGKTFTALKAINNLELESKFLIIAVPQKELAEQWEGECEGVFQVHDYKTLKCYSDNPRWKQDISRFIRQVQRGKVLGILIVVLGTLRTDTFIGKVGPILSDSYLIFDEVHEAGSYQNRKIFDKLKGIKVRIGLSATPSRAWDNDGNEAIKDFFGGEPIFNWDMGKAINPPEGYEPCLCKYNYYLYEANLNGDELKRYESISKDIRRKIAILTRGGKKSFSHISDEPSLTALLNQRADLIKECKDKLRVLDEIIHSRGDNLIKSLIYCNDKLHVEEVTKKLWGFGIKCRQYDGDIPHFERSIILEKFKNEDLRFIVAIKCLDQGVDIPKCNSAILMTSSRNPREYIQRRGRVLRLHDSKERAYVFDILVFPHPVRDLLSGKIRLYEFEHKLLMNQIERVKLFISNAQNSDESYLKLLDYESIKIETGNEDG